MAYGRLDIFWPDGRLESVTLTGQTVSVGRSAGNSVVLDTETVSRYHFSITHENDTVSITDLDSENGTYVDGVRLPSNQARVLDGVEEIQAGHLRIIFHALDETPTSPMPLGGEEDTQRIEREEATFRLQVDATRLDVWPAASSSAELAITNIGTEPQLYNIEVQGLPRGWARINRPRLEIAPNETAYVLINIKPPRRPDNTPRSYPTQINVYSDDRPDITLTAPLDVRIQGYSGFGVALARPLIENRESIRIFLHNQGSAPLNIRLRGASPDGALILRLPDGILRLAAGQRMQITGEAVPRQRALLGQSTIHRFDILAQSQSNAPFTAVVSGKAEVAARFKIWQLMAVGGIAASLLILAFLAALGALAPRPPQIRDLQVNSGQLAQGDSLILQWASDNTDAINIRVNQAPFLTLDGTANSVEIDTSELSGDVTITVQGSGDGSTDEESVSVYIYREMLINSFTVEPATVVRNVISTINLSWDVAGATSVEISGLEAFTNAPIQRTFDSIDSLQGISGVATGPLILSLRAEDEVGNVAERQVTVTVSDPTCIANEEVVLREGPNIRNQQVGIIPAGERVVVDAQDGNAGWLRIVLPSAVRGWGERDLFTCDSSFQVESLQAVLNVPPPQQASPMPSSQPQTGQPPTGQPQANQPQIGPTLPTNVTATLSAAPTQTPISTPPPSPTLAIETAP